MTATTSFTMTGINGRKIKVFQPAASYGTEWQVRVNGVVTRSFAAGPALDRYVAAERAKGHRVTVGSSEGF